MPPIEEVQKALTQRMLVALRGQMVYQGGDAVRAPVALAVVKLLRHLPQDVVRRVLPSILQSVANLLRKRLQRLRLVLFSVTPGHLAGFT